MTTDNNTKNKHIQKREHGKKTTLQTNEHIKRQINKHDQHNPNQTKQTHIKHRECKKRSKTHTTQHKIIKNN